MPPADIQGTALKEQGWRCDHINRKERQGKLAHREKEMRREKEENYG